MERVYLITLSKETENPLGPKSDEVGKAEQKREKEKSKEAEEKKPEAKASRAEKKIDEKKLEPPAKKPVVVKVDTDGIQDRIVALQVASGNYRDIRMIEDRIFYLRRTAGDDTGDEDDDSDGRDRKSHLCSYSIDDRKEIVLGDANDYQISFECWRHMRDFFFAPTMNGIDWKAMRDKYAALLPFVNHRNDLTYLLGELIAELNSGHAYVAGGERPETPRVKLGLLGAELSRDPTTKAYKIDRILPGENW